MGKKIDIGSTLKEVVDAINSSSQSAETTNKVEEGNILPVTSGAVWSAFQTALNSMGTAQVTYDKTTKTLKITASRFDPISRETTQTFELESGEYEDIYSQNGKFVFKVSFTRTVEAPPYTTFVSASIEEEGSGVTNFAPPTITIDSGGKTATISISGGTQLIPSPEVTVTYSATYAFDF